MIVNSRLFDQIIMLLEFINLVIVAQGKGPRIFIPQNSDNWISIVKTLILSRSVSSQDIQPEPATDRSPHRSNTTSVKVRLNNPSDLSWRKVGDRNSKYKNFKSIIGSNVEKSGLSTAEKARSVFVSRWSP